MAVQNEFPLELREDLRDGFMHLSKSEQNMGLLELLQADGQKRRSYRELMCENEDGQLVPDWAKYEKYRLIWVHRWNKLKKLEHPEEEEELRDELLKLHEFIQRTTERTALRKLLAVFDQIWEELEARRVADLMDTMERLRDVRDKPWPLKEYRVLHTMKKTRKA